MSPPTLREEIASLRAEVEQLRRNSEQPKAKANVEETTAGDEPDGLRQQLGELGSLVQSMLDEAEETFADHPVAAISGALALGIVIGRLTAR